ncbi:MAG: hypothetical protein HWN81_00485 [Candidatus Lokiarchaeota archaeon]|nr:hypothetical protein [Candidatus Lokiarchaeota archaeon]
MKRKYLVLEIDLDEHVAPIMVKDLDNDWYVVEDLPSNTIVEDLTDEKIEELQEMYPGDETWRFVPLEYYTDECKDAWDKAYEKYVSDILEKEVL